MSNSEFIGNATLIDTLVSKYTEPFNDYSTGKPKVNVTQSELDSLKEIQQYTHNEVITFCSGIEGIGHLMTRLDRKGKGVADEQIDNIGYLIEHLGRVVSSHAHILDTVNFQIELAEVVRS